MRKKIIILRSNTFLYFSALARSQAKDQLTNEQKDMAFQSPIGTKKTDGFIFILRGPLKNAVSAWIPACKRNKGSFWRDMSTVWHYQTAMDWQWLVGRALQCSILMLILKI